MATTTVSLSDGGYVESWYVDSTGAIHLQKYDAGGHTVGPEYTHGAFGPDNTLVALNNGGYVWGYETNTTGGPVFVGEVFGADASHLTEFTGGATGSVVASPSGGFLLSALPSEGHSSFRPDAYITLYDDAGHVLTQAPVDAAQGAPMLAVDGSGLYQATWNDGTNSHTLTLDPNNPESYTRPPTPSYGQAVDDVAPVTGIVSAGGATNDATPLIRLAVTEVGWIGVAVATGGATPEQPNVYLPVTAGDVARGYVEYSPGALPEGQLWISTRAEDADGVVSAITTYPFTIDTQAPTAPTITKVTDDVGAQQGAVAAGGSTDDSAPAVQVSIQGAGAGLSDTVYLHDSNGAIVGQHIIEQTDLDKGYVSIAASLSDGAHDLSANVIDRAGNIGASSSDFAVTVQPDATTGGDTSSGGSGSGQVLTADTAPDTITGGAGADTITASQGHDLLTGNGGADSFVFKALPWNAGDIADFTVGTDKLDLSALFQASGYAGSDPVADGYVTLASDGAGGTEVLYDTDGPAGGNTIQFRITDLDHVSPSGLTWAQLSEATTGTGGAGGTGGTGGGDTSSGGSGSGQVLTADTAPDTITGGAGADTITASQGHDLLTGNGGADSFVFKALPWNAGDIADFTVGTDKLDLSALFQASGYAGSDPVADGYVTLASDGAGGTEVLYDTDGAAGGNTIQFRITDLDHVSPSGLTWAQLSGGGGSTGDSSEGQVITAHQPGDTLSGGAGADTLNTSQGPDQLTGAGGADHFVWNALPWNAGHVTDFTPGSDVLDLRPLFQQAGYTGSDPIGDGYLEFRADGGGDTQVYFDPDGPSSSPQWPYLITTLDHVAPNQIGSGDFLFH